MTSDSVSAAAAAISAPALASDTRARFASAVLRSRTLPAALQYSRPVLDSDAQRCTAARASCARLAAEAQARTTADLLHLHAGHITCSCPADIKPAERYDLWLNLQPLSAQLCSSLPDPFP